VKNFDNETGVTTTRCIISIYFLAKNVVLSLTRQHIFKWDTLLTKYEVSAVPNSHSFNAWR